MVKSADLLFEIKSAHACRLITSDCMLSFLDIPLGTDGPLITCLMT